MEDGLVEILGRLQLDILYFLLVVCLCQGGYSTIYTLLPRSMRFLNLSSECV